GSGQLTAGQAPDLAACQSDEERAAFFEAHSAFELLDAGLMEEEPATVRYRLKPKKSQQLNIRVEPDLLESVKAVALKKGLAYQTLIRLWIQEKLREEKQA
ncbi:MAG TPA: CopG family antitoxin, partial [Candidatus Obscuribacterales bacterium]